jgi:hypothetical protein
LCSSFLKVTLVFFFFDFSLSMDLTKSLIQYSQQRVIWFRYKMIHNKKIWNAYLTYNQFLKYNLRGGRSPLRFPLKYAHALQILWQRYFPLRRLYAWKKTYKTAYSIRRDRWGGEVFGPLFLHWNGRLSAARVLRIRSRLIITSSFPLHRSVFG